MDTTLRPLRPAVVHAVGCVGRGGRGKDDALDVAQPREAREVRAGERELRGQGQLERDLDRCGAEIFKNSQIRRDRSRDS